VEVSTVVVSVVGAVEVSTVVVSVVGAVEVSTVVVSVVGAVEVSTVVVSVVGAVDVSTVATSVVDPPVEGAVGTELTEGSLTAGSCAFATETGSKHPNTRARRTATTPAQRRRRSALGRGSPGTAFPP
jgi:hypothetical protein